MKLGEEEKKVEADYVLVTVGRRPNTDELGLEQIGIKLHERVLSKSINNAVRILQTSMQLVISYQDLHLHIKLLMKEKLLLKQFQAKNLKLITWQFQLFASQIQNLHQLA